MAPLNNGVLERLFVRLVKSNETLYFNLRLGKKTGKLAIAAGNNSLVFFAKEHSPFRRNGVGIGLGGHDQTGPYDASGASMYVIVIIVIYALTIVVMIAATMSDRNKSRNLDRQVANYVKNLNPINREARMFKADLMKQQIISAGSSPNPTPTQIRNQLPFIAETDAETPTSAE